MDQMYKRVKAISPVLVALGVKALVIVVAFLLPMDLSRSLGMGGEPLEVVDFTPEVWLSLLAFVFGTLIIVISIASEKTPKLIDLFVGEYWSRLFIWLIAFSSIENVCLHFVAGKDPWPGGNLLIINNYLFLPAFILSAIPYIFYILKFTRSSNVIKRIFYENLRNIKAAKYLTTSNAFNENHHDLFESINQLHDLLQYIQFKEPKADIIHRFGTSLRFYLHQKKKFPEFYFNLTHSVKNDISFRTLDDKYQQIENERTFYEQKILRVLGASYLLLIKDSHYDLASLCGSELSSSGKTACELGEQPAVDAVIIHFNTILRFGINHSLRNREIRNVYNTVYHYSQLINTFISKGEDARVIQCCRYLSFYANEVGKLTTSEPLLLFLVETFAMELKKILMSLHDQRCSKEQQTIVLNMFNELIRDRSLSSDEHQWLQNRGLRLIQIALCLFYLNIDESTFVGITVRSILNDLKGLGKKQIMHIIEEDCEKIRHEPENFWEETDQGTRNIYYSPYKLELDEFQRYFLENIALIHA